MATGDEDGRAPQRFVSFDQDERRDWLARHDVRRVLVSIAFYKLGLSGEEIDELIQDFYRDKLFPVARAYDPDREDLALARTAFWRYGLNWLRKRTTGQVGLTFSFVDPDHADGLAAATAVPPFPHHLEPNEQVALLRRAKDRLSEVDRQYIQLAHYEDRPHSEIAQILGSTVGTVKVATHRAKDRLKALILDEGFCLCISDIVDWPRLAARFASGFSAPDTSVGAFCAQLPDDMPVVIEEIGSRNAARKRLLHEVNAVCRGADLSLLPGLPVTAASLICSSSAATVGRVQRNRLVVEYLFDPLILKTAHGAGPK